MKSIQPMEAMQVVGRGSTKLLFETSFDVKPPMSTPVGESYEVDITEYSAFDDRVLIKGTIDKTLYYKHPHGKKEKDSNTNKESDNKGDQSEHQQENSSDESTTSTKAQKFLSKIKRRKGKTNQQKEKSAKNDNQESNNTDQQKKNETSEQSSSKSSELACLSGSGQIVDSAHGIVHFHQQALEFSGTVDLPGVRPGDLIHVERAEGSTFEPFVAKAAENENYTGLINSATHTFAIDVELVATRSKPETHRAKRKKSFRSLPLDNNADTAR